MRRRRTCWPALNAARIRTLVLFQDTVLFQGMELFQDTVMWKRENDHPKRME